jgi:hypothetical protein
MVDSSFALLSIVDGCTNRGNLIIDYATRQVLNLAEKDVVVVNAFQSIPAGDIAAVNACSAMIMPGATLLQPEDHLAARQIADITCPILPIGVALRSRFDVADLSVARHMTIPVGSRDPFTHQSLLRKGIASYLTGCQTLLLGRPNDWQHREGPIVASLGLGPQTALRECITACADVRQTIVVNHAPGAQSHDFHHARIRVEDLDEPATALRLYGEAAVVVTGRIHALLVCIALGTPVVFFGGWYDSRYTLVHYLGVPIEPAAPTRIRRLVERCLNGQLGHEVVLERADGLRQAMQRYLDDVASPTLAGQRG